VASVLYQLISRLPFRLPLALVLAGVATWSQSRVVLPFTLQDACIGCAFIALGDFCRPYVLRYAEWLGEKAWPRAAALTLGSYCTLLVGLTLLPGQGIDLGSNYYNPLSLFSSCVGFWFVISAAVLARRTAVADEFLAFCGRNSFAILILHNMDILGIRDWAGTDATFLVCTLLVYPFLVYLFRRAQAARKQPSTQPPASPERQMAGVGAEP
jgi:fucose 4-O-acetylase-like acetyltransferase